MDVEMKMPDLSTTGDEVRVVSWVVEVGGKVTRGAPLLEVETDKATMEVEAIAGGVLKQVLAPPGTNVGVGQVIAVIESEAGTPTVASSPAPAQPASAAPASAGPAVANAPAPAPATTVKAGGMFARNRARAPEPPAAPTGAGGGAAATGAATPPALPLSVAQRTVARRMQQSKQTIPHYYLQRSFDAGRIVALRAAAPGEPIAWDAFFATAAARALARYERIRCRIDGEQLRPQAADAVNVAVDIDGDLYVVLVSKPAAKSLAQVSAEIRHAVERLRAGDADAARVRPADITISNLGGVGVETFLPIINPPEAAVLGIGAIRPQAVVVDGQVVVGQRATLTLCVDHRIVNGRYAGAFLGELVAQLEAFAGA